jgi:hypothetical protein
MGTKGVLTRPGRGLRAALAAAVLTMTALVLVPAQASAKHYTARPIGALDCNGFSPVQRPARPTMPCTDVRGFANVNNNNVDEGRFYDNGHYIGHDEPDMTFLSSAPRSGNNVTWTETLPRDPSAPPTVSTPGTDVAHWFELSVAPWFSMALCDPQSYPLHPCTPESDQNAPRGEYQGAGSSFLETQFYPPGYAPFATAVSCDNTHWCASLHINDLECTFGFAHCNLDCEEPTNFAFVQTNGEPTGPPSPQKSDLATNTPNAHTLLMNPGDRLVVRILDAPVPGEPGHKALKLVIQDLTTGQTGYMQASAKNGFQATSIKDCSGTPFDYQPEYNTAKRSNIVPWAALQTDISTQFEIGHFEGCTSLSDPVSVPVAPDVSDTTWLRCHGPYETSTTPDGAENPESTDAPCFPAGDTHGALQAPPDTVTGCLDFAAGGDLDFDGSSYWPEWPVGASPTSTYPGSFVQALPRTGERQYEKFFIQTDTALSESTCTPDTPKGCAVPAPNAPGKFYPYWSRVSAAGTCVLEFGNVSAAPGIQDFGKAAQYGENTTKQFGYPEFIGPVMRNTCRA